ncbi:unnamed protein product [Notodromas monacha]|uniref:Hepatocyte growth factor-regulated tyrosine kinase substrate n=1 Tax=Notodromas monacha TaxID=399045 RepID=A0A7R9BQK2_9CRUS|nr:unnamed protein product [Notodromas monacha]CAG0918499.1 unnamed protein product [Notodromas monacha]
MFRSTGMFDKLLDKATSHLNLEEPDLVVTLQLCDNIRQKDVQASYALSALKKKLYDKNPNVQLFALQVLESWVKNCGVLVHDELLGSKDMMEELHDIVKQTPNEKVRKKILELIQVWAHAFRGQSKYQPVQDIMNIMKAEGYSFPQLKESDAMFMADTAPNWIDGEACMQCRSTFSMFTRKHHCRACGKIFCDPCSQHSLPLPHLGIEKFVRVCDYCFEKHRKSLGAAATGTKEGTDDLPPEYLNSPLSKENQVPKKKTEEELREEEELQLAIALSQSECESKAQEDPVELDPELARYLDRSFWETKQQKAEAREEKKEKVKKSSSGLYPENSRKYEADTSIAPQASAPPMASSAPAVNANEMSFTNNKYMSNENSIALETPVPQRAVHPVEEDAELNDFVNNLRSQLEIFTNRMESNKSRGRSIAVDSSVQTLFMNIASLNSTLIRKTNTLEEERVLYEGMQDRLAQLKDARAALDALREEHREKIRREEEEAERQRQMQMAHKLAIMRKKKHEYLEYQRQMALQRMQEEERILTMKNMAAAAGAQMMYPPGVVPMPGGVNGPTSMPGVIPGYAPQMPGAPPHPPQHVMPSSQMPGDHYDGSPVHQSAPYYPPQMPPGGVYQMPVVQGYRMPTAGPPPGAPSSTATAVAATSAAQQQIAQVVAAPAPPQAIPEPEPPQPEPAPLICFD